MISKLASSPLFGVLLCIVTFECGRWIQKKTKLAIFNPLLIAIALSIAVLKALDVTLDEFNQGGALISLFLGPATAVLALSVYRQAAVLKKYFLPVLGGCAVGALVSMGSAALLCKAFRLDEALTAALIPKSVTTPIAMEISRAHGGLVAVTVAAVIITGILGAVLAPLLIRLLGITDPVAQGLAIGASSHAVGTTKAVELGEIQGAMSAIAIGVCGLITVVLSLFL